MLRLERSAAFWASILSDPSVIGAMGAVRTDRIGAAMADPSVTPLASSNGGFWFVQLDTSARVFELHTMYTAAGWGREVHAAAKEAFNRMFTRSCELIVTEQMEANPRSQPPRSFGFKALGAFAPTPFGSARTWMLTREAWLNSPGGRSSCQ